MSNYKKIVIKSANTDKPSRLALAMNEDIIYLYEEDFDISGGSKPLVSKDLGLLSSDMYSIYKDKSRLIYSGSPLMIIKDNFGYNSFINYNDIINNKQKIFILANNEKIELKFKEEFIKYNWDLEVIQVEKEAIISKYKFLIVDALESLYWHLN